MSKKKQIGQEHSHSEQSFPERDARQAFLLKLSDALRPLSDSIEIQQTAMRVLGEELEVDRVLYGGVHEGENYVVSDNYVRGNFPKLVGLFPVSAFGEVTEWLRKGETINVDDMNADERLSEATRAAFTEAGVYSAVGVPLVKGGRWVVNLGVHHGTPRRWTNEEIALVQETAERTWASVERAEAEEALRASEAKYRTLFDAIDEGFVVCELLFDNEGKPFDLLVLETNASFERLMKTTTNSMGKRALEIFPNAEASWFEAYARVVETGESLRFENNLAALDRWFNVYISRVGDAGGRRFAIVFNDISERKRHEANLTFLNEVSHELVRLTKADEIMSALGAKIGEHFGVVRCSFAEINDAAGEVVVRHAWYREGHVDSAGFRTQRLRDYISDELSQTARAGEMMIVRDTRTDPRTDDAAYAPRNTRAFLTMPFLRDRKWRATLTIADTNPHDWRDDEIDLMRELTNRIWTRLERARAEEALRLIIESAKGYAIFTTDGEGVINSWNPGAAQAFGWSKADILGQYIDVLFIPEDCAAGEPQKELETARAEGIAPDIRWHQRKDGSRVFINGEVRPLYDGQHNGFFKIGRDETAQRQAEEALHESQKQLQSLNETLEQNVQEKTEEVRQLASDVINATQQERQRISRVLHDDLQQRVYAIQVQLSFLRDELPSENHSARTDASTIEKELAEIGKIARNLSIDLSPPILPGEGLSRAIDWLAARMREQYALPVELQATGPFVISNQELHVFLFNCVRELLFNVVKHAEASRAVVSLVWLDNGMQIEVRDDGKGFPDNVSEQGKASKQGDLPRSLGLPSIRRQLSLFGGGMEINSKPGAGTQVILIVPVAESSQGVLSLAD